MRIEKALSMGTAQAVRAVIIRRSAGNLPKTRTTCRRARHPSPAALCPVCTTACTALHTPTCTDSASGPAGRRNFNVPGILIISGRAPTLHSCLVPIPLCTSESLACPLRSFFAPIHVLPPSVVYVRLRTPSQSDADPTLPMVPPTSSPQTLPSEVREK